MRAATLRRRRAAAQLLAGLPRRAASAAARPPAGAARVDPCRAVAHLLAVQAQDLRAARLALRARAAAANAGDVDAALTDDRSIVAAWLMRGTLHLVAREDYGWLLALTAPLTAATTRRRLAQLGGSAEDGERVIVRALADDGPLPRAALGDRLAAAGVAAEGQILPHLLARAAAGGHILLGPVREGTQCFALARDWLGAPERPPDREAALAELARRYLRGHGPAGAADLAAWSGLPLRDARAGLAAIARELEQQDGLVDLAAREPPPARFPPRLLGAFDPYLLGWHDRAFAVAPRHARAVHPGGGILRATAVVDGRVVGTWARRRGEVVVAPFAPLAARAQAALRREASAIERFDAERTAH